MQYTNCDNEMKLGAVHRSPGIYLKAGEKRGQSPRGDYLMKVCATSHRLQWGPLHPNDVGRIEQPFREGKRKNISMDPIIIFSQSVVFKSSP
jgi:hypothetical protein